MDDLEVPVKGIDLVQFAMQNSLENRLMQKEQYGRHSQGQMDNEIAKAYDIDGNEYRALLNIYGKITTEKGSFNDFFEKSVEVKKGKVSSLKLNFCGFNEIPEELNEFKLEELCLGYNNITDYSMVGTMKSLKTLRLEKAGLRDIYWIDKLENLDGIDLSHNTELEDFEPLKQLKRLKQLNAGHTGMNSLDFFREMYSMEKVDISFTNVRGLEPLYGLKKLKVLNKHNTEIPDEEVKKLRYALKTVLIVNG